LTFIKRGAINAQLDFVKVFTLKRRREKHTLVFLGTVLASHPNMIRFKNPYFIDEIVEIFKDPS
jgi:hypothetical protein